jgi:hypothetical protein
MKRFFFFLQTSHPSVQRHATAQDSYAPFLAHNSSFTMASTTDDTEVTEAIASLSLKAQEEQEEHRLEEERLSSDLATFLSNPSLKAALADGSLKLDQYSVTVEQELHELESQCIDVYRNKAKEISSLRQELESCDAVLGALQEMLLGFQADLGGLSGDIRSLQDKSRTLGVQLRNRRMADDGLREFLRHIVIAPGLAHAICRGPVNTTFLQSVHELNRINADVHDKEPKEWSCDTPPSQTVAGHEMKDHVHKLRLVAVSRIRDYFLGQIALLRRPQTNVRMIQVHGLLKYADLQDFLDEASPEVAIEIYNVYVESMGKVRILRHHVTRCSFRRTHRNAWIPDFVCSLSNISSAATTTGFHENCHHSP